MIDPVMFNSLRRVRGGVYGAFGARRDALFELLDAAMVAGLVPSLAHLSLTAVHRRKWGSLYDALSAGSMNVAALRELVGRWPLDDGQPIYALDTSVWPRDDAETSPAADCGFQLSLTDQHFGGIHRCEGDCVLSRAPVRLGVGRNALWRVDPEQFGWVDRVPAVVGSRRRQPP